MGIVDVDESTCFIDDVGPMPVVRPRTAAELGDLVRAAAAKRQALYPLGGRTALGFGLPPERPGTALDLRGLDAVIDYPARDMTITVQAGITLARLHEVLAAEKQRLPLDVPLAGRATLGGVLAVNASGSRRFGLGTARDYVIGISAVNDAGHETKAGGRVVKNVAGYDLCKLLIGSLGTLGVITQVTLKVKPQPEEHGVVTVGCRTEALEPLLSAVHQSRTRPVCVDVLNANALRTIEARLPTAPWAVVVGFEDNREAVLWQVQQVVRELTEAHVTGLDARAGASADAVWNALGGFGGFDARLTFRASLLPRGIPEFLRRCDALSDWQLQAHAGNGIVHGHLGRDATLEQARTMLRTVQEAVAATNGTVVLPRCPPAWKQTLSVWGTARSDAWLMRRVKEALDPHRLFNPGRFVDGI